MHIVIRRKFSPVLIAVLLLFFVEQHARAYTDPGSGALLWQIVAAGFVGVMFYIRKILGWFRRKPQERGHND